MKKPHEQEWKVEQSSASSKTEVVGADGTPVARVSVTYVDKGAFREADMDTATAKANLIAAAPDMARALLAHGTEDVRGVWHSRKCIAMGREALCSDECRMDRAALRKAGVLP